MKLIAIARAWTALAIVLAISMGVLCYAQSAPLEDLANFPRSSLEITHGKQHHAFTVWIADTPQRSEQGLMFVRDLPVDEGMLFPESQPRRISMWMKNTYIGLDMVFVDADGRIGKIVEHAVPQSLDTIDSGGPVAAVLEIKDGEASRRGLTIGDKVSWSSSKPPAAVAGLHQ
jgi:uncharacterized membrane protein (UPF0127 family)